VSQKAQANRAFLPLPSRDFLEKKMNQELVQAKAKSQRNDKKGALAHLKRKKVYEREVEKINNGMLNLEQQVMSIESSSVTKDIIDAMKSGKTALQQVTAGIDVDEVADLQDDIAELQANQAEIDEVISTPMDGLGIGDDLEEEWAALEADMMEEEVSKLPSVPTTRTPVKSPVDSLPAAPTHTPKLSDDDAALAELQAALES